VSIGLIILPYQLRFNEWRPTIVGKKTLYGLISLYMILNAFIIILIWWPSKTTIPFYVAPVVATSVLVFGAFYWFVFAGVLPALGYEIDSAPDELVDGSRVVIYRVCLLSTDILGGNRRANVRYRGIKQDLRNTLQISGRNYSKNNSI
jgi:hypothetical protein